jgi:hypothetical protein
MLFSAWRIHPRRESYPAQDATWNFWTIGGLTDGYFGEHAKCQRSEDGPMSNRVAS